MNECHGRIGCAERYARAAGNVVLVGFRGTGKSSVAELVAMATDRGVFHMDATISERAGSSIPEFVERRGWDAFWALESEVADEAAKTKNTVIDTGGGVIRRDENMTSLKSTGSVFWLTAHATTIKERIRDETHRPSLTGRKSFLDEVDEILEAREPVYARYADYIIETDGRTLSEIANDIIHIVCGGIP